MADGSEVRVVSVGVRVEEKDDCHEEVHKTVPPRYKEWYWVMNSVCDGSLTDEQ